MKKFLLLLLCLASLSFARDVWPLDQEFSYTCAGKPFSVTVTRPHAEPLQGAIVHVAYQGTPFWQAIGDFSTDIKGVATFTPENPGVYEVNSYLGVIRFSDTETVTIPSCGSCINNFECGIKEACVAGKCAEITGICGEAKNHEWVPYRCCLDSDCPGGFVCKSNSCIADEYTQAAQHAQAIAASQQPQPCSYTLCTSVLGNCTNIPVTIQVTRSEGIPLQGASVHVSYKSAQFWQHFGDYTTDLHGNIVFTPVLAGEYEYSTNYGIKWYGGTNSVRVYNCFPCSSDSDCGGNEKCVQNGCAPVTGDCGYPKNHEWVKFECCRNMDCTNGGNCINHTCVSEVVSGSSTTPSDIKATCTLPYACRT